MAVVVDASVVGAIAFGEPDGPTLAAHIEGETLLAPALLDFELANVALKKARRRPDLAEAIGVSLAAALSLPIRRLPVPCAAAFAIARRTGLTAYDASYLWLAQAHDAELVTLDVKLQRLADESE
ncbi:MAG TPA: type II toxin-antitoxin system VapC family toxin [Vicinamibacterales bacterium]|nr:type II toxin-antitoxin system VapC family toxin [Vicinamibacterales bacterium]